MAKNESYYSGEKYNLLAKKQGYRSRAAFKLVQIDKEENILKKNLNIIDLGCAPGGWSQVVSERLKGTGSIVGIDVLNMPRLKGVEFIQCDLRNFDVSQLKTTIDVVISDIAPNLSGIKSVDNENIFDLNKLTVDIALDFLCKGGTLNMKTFQNSFLKTLRKDMELSFKIVQTYKPVASKKQSGEIYLYGVK